MEKIERTGEEIITRSARVYLDKDGIVRFVVNAGNEHTLEDAKEHTAAGLKASKGRDYLCFVDLRGAKSITREARQHYASEEGSRHFIAIAMLIGSPLSRLIGNFYIGINKARFPLRLFTSEEDAVRWLKGFIK